MYGEYVFTSYAEREGGDLKEEMSVGDRNQDQVPGGVGVLPDSDEAQRSGTENKGPDDAVSPIITLADTKKRDTLVRDEMSEEGDPQGPKPVAIVSPTPGEDAGDAPAPRPTVPENSKVRTAGEEGDNTPAVTARASGSEANDALPTNATNAGSDRDDDIDHGRWLKGDGAPVMLFAKKTAPQLRRLCLLDGCRVSLAVNSSTSTSAENAGSLNDNTLKAQVATSEGRRDRDNDDDNDGDGDDGSEGATQPPLLPSFPPRSARSSSMPDLLAATPTTTSGAGGGAGGSSDDDALRRTQAQPPTAARRRLFKKAPSFLSSSFGASATSPSVVSSQSAQQQTPSPNSAISFTLSRRRSSSNLLLNKVRMKMSTTLQKFWSMEVVSLHYASAAPGVGDSGDGGDSATLPSLFSTCVSVTTTEGDSGHNLNAPVTWQATPQTPPFAFILTTRKNARIHLAATNQQAFDACISALSEALRAQALPGPHGITPSATTSPMTTTNDDRRPGGPSGGGIADASMNPIIDEAVADTIPATNLEDDGTQEAAGEKKQDAARSEADDRDVLEDDQHQDTEEGTEGEGEEREEEEDRPAVPDTSHYEDYFSYEIDPILLPFIHTLDSRTTQVMKNFQLPCSVLDCVTYSWLNDEYTVQAYTALKATISELLPWESVGCHFPVTNKSKSDPAPGDTSPVMSLPFLARTMCSRHPVAVRLPGVPKETVIHRTQHIILTRLRGDGNGDGDGDGDGDGAAGDQDHQSSPPFCCLVFECDEAKGIPYGNTFKIVSRWVISSVPLDDTGKAFSQLDLGSSSGPSLASFANECFVTVHSDVLFSSNHMMRRKVQSGTIGEMNRSCARWKDALKSCTWPYCGQPGAAPSLLEHLLGSQEDRAAAHLPAFEDSDSLRRLAFTDSFTDVLASEPHQAQFLFAKQKRPAPSQPSPTTQAPFQRKRGPTDTAVLQPPPPTTITSPSASSAAAPQSSTSATSAQSAAPRLSPEEDTNDGHLILEGFICPVCTLKFEDAEGLVSHYAFKHEKGRSRIFYPMDSMDDRDNAANDTDSATDGGPDGTSPLNEGRGQPPQQEERLVVSSSTHIMTAATTMRSANSRGGGTTTALVASQRTTSIWSYFAVDTQAGSGGDRTIATTATATTTSITSTTAAPASPTTGHIEVAPTGPGARATPKRTSPSTGPLANPNSSSTTAMTEEEGTEGVGEDEEDEEDEQHRQHLDEGIVGRSGFVCPVCFESFLSAEQLLEHHASAHP